MYNCIRWLIQRYKKSVNKRLPCVVVGGDVPDVATEIAIKEG